MNDNEQSSVPGKANQLEVTSRKEDLGGLTNHKKLLTENANRSQHK